MECPHLDSQVNTCVFVCTFFVLCWNIAQDNVDSMRPL